MLTRTIKDIYFFSSNSLFKEAAGAGEEGGEGGGVEAAVIRIRWAFYSYCYSSFVYCDMPKTA